MVLPTNGLAKPFVGFCFARKIGFGSYMGIIVRCCKFALRGAAFRKIQSVRNRVKGFYAVFRESVTVNVQRGRNLRMSENSRNSRGVYSRAD